MLFINSKQRNFVIVTLTSFLDQLGAVTILLVEKVDTGVFRSCTGGKDWPQCYTTFFMLNLTAYEIFHVHKFKIP